jgi:hypothetical protein
MVALDEMLFYCTSSTLGFRRYLFFLRLPMMLEKAKTQKTDTSAPSIPLKVNFVKI